MNDQTLSKRDGPKYQLDIVAKLCNYTITDHISFTPGNQALSTATQLS